MVKTGFIKRVLAFLIVFSMVFAIFTIGGASAAPQDDAELPDWLVHGEYAMNVTPLKDIYKDYFMMGNIVTINNVNNTSAANQERYNILKHHFDTLTFENDMKPRNIWATGSNLYTVPAPPSFTNIDNAVRRLKDDGIILHGHTLLWHDSVLRWMTMSAGAWDNAATARYKPYAEAKANTKYYIDTIAGHFYNHPDGISVYSWDVINEAVKRDIDYPIDEDNWGYHTYGAKAGTTQKTPWFEAYKIDAPAGVNPWDYVYDAFLFAREADPNAILYLNEYSMEIQDKARMVYHVVNGVNKRYALEHPEANGRLLIEGIGMQQHDSFNNNLDDFEKSLKLLIQTGCRISITELDVEAPGYTQNDTLDFEDEIKQAAYFAKLFSILKENSEHIERVSFWGLNDANWKPDALCSIFTRGNLTKYAYVALADTERFLAEYGHVLERQPIDTSPREAKAAYGAPVLGTGDALWDTTEILQIDRYQWANTGATGTAKVLWDENNLYAQIKVTDPLLNSSGSQDYEHDSIELFFSEFNDKSPAYKTGMGQYRVNYNNKQSFWLGGATSSAGFASYAEITDYGYMVEMKLPFQYSTPKKGDLIDFDISINDANIRGKRVNVASWCDTTGYAWLSAEFWGQLLLADAGPWLTKATANAKSISIVENPKNIWQVTFTVNEEYHNGTNKDVTYAITVGKNSDGLVDLGDYVLKYDIKGNGSNIKAFKIEYMK